MNKKKVSNLISGYERYIKYGKISQKLLYLIKFKLKFNSF